MQPVMPVWIHFVVMFAVAGLALWLGRRDVKLVASCYLMVNMLFTGFGSFDGTLPKDLEIWLYILEATCFAGLFLYFRRVWLLAPFLIAGAEVGTGLTSNTVEMSRWLYGTIQLGWFYALWGVVTLATLAPIARNRRYSRSPA